MKHIMMLVVRAGRRMGNLMLKSHNKTIVEALGRSPIHPFPARMAPGIALDALGEDKRSMKVLDPMAGSGTVLAVARARGHHAIGVDLDPLAVLLGRVWTKPIDPEKSIVKAHEVLARAVSVFESTSAGMAYPFLSDEETRRFVRYWFDSHARRQLFSLATCIKRVRDKTIRDVLWCAFSKLIITKSSGASLAMDLSHSRPHKKFTHAPVKPFDRFIYAVSSVVANCPVAGGLGNGPETTVTRGDARQLDLPDEYIDLVLTSPPYLNAIDYMRCSKFSLVWMGYTIGDLRKVRAMSVGTEASSLIAKSDYWVKGVIEGLSLTPQLSSRDYALLSTYTWDMGLALGEAARVLKKGGSAVYVVGDSVSRGTFISNSEIVVAAAEKHGMCLQSRQTRALPENRRYMPPPRGIDSKNSMDARMRREVVLVFSKQ